MKDPSLELEGLTVRIDRLVYRYGGPTIPERTPHVFIYFITIRNDSDRTVVLLGRKWVVENESGESLVIEGDKIVGETPTLRPGDEFSYNSFHMAAQNARASGSFHGVDEFENRIHVSIPAFAMIVPEV